MYNICLMCVHARICVCVYVCVVWCGLSVFSGTLFGNGGIKRNKAGSLILRKPRPEIAGSFTLDPPKCIENMFQFQISFTNLFYMILCNFPRVTS